MESIILEADDSSIVPNVVVSVSSGWSLSEDVEELSGSKKLISRLLDVADSISEVITSMMMVEDEVLDTAETSALMPVISLDGTVSIVSREVDAVNNEVMAESSSDVEAPASRLALDETSLKSDELVGGRVPLLLSSPEPGSLDNSVLESNSVLVEVSKVVSLVVGLSRVGVASGLARLGSLLKDSPALGVLDVPTMAVVLSAGVTDAAGSSMMELEYSSSLAADELAGGV